MSIQTDLRNVPLPTAKRLSATVSQLKRSSLFWFSENRGKLISLAWIELALRADAEQPMLVGRDASIPVIEFTIAPATTRKSVSKEK